MTTIDWPARPKRRGGRIALLVAAAVLLFGGGTFLSYYVDALWFSSLGFGDVFWKTLNIQGTVFAVFAAVTFVVLYGSFLLMKPQGLADFTGGAILINGQPLKLPVEPVLRLIALGVALAIAFAAGAGMTAEWPTFALYWYQTAEKSPAIDPIFGRPDTFYLFTLPAWETIAGWLLTLAVAATAMAAFFVAIASGSRLVAGRRTPGEGAPWRGLSVSVACLLAVLAVKVYLSRFDRLAADHTVFSGVTYTDAHVAVTGLLIVSLALAVGAAIAAVNAIAAPRVVWLGAAFAPAVVTYVAVSLVTSYVGGFIVKPNELVRERPFIAHNIEYTRRAFALDRVADRDFPADTGPDAIDVQANQATLQNIRLWDWRALQDTLRQIQEIRTYYDFPDIDIDRYAIDGQVRQMMLATRELNVNKLPEGSRNWINEKLIYTHGYGITMNPVNGFTPEGLPILTLRDMPVQSTVASVKVTRPEIYFGELTTTDVYVKTRQREFNYPQGGENNFTTYQGEGGIVIGGFLRRVLIALDRGDITKLPFSDDVTPESQLLMRRTIRDRIAALAPFLTIDPDPYVVIGDDGRLSWIVDGFTTSDSYPYSRHYQLGRDDVNYIRNSVKIVVDAYDGKTTFYVFDPDDPIIAAYRGAFPSLFRDASEMPPAMKRHVRYPELMLELQAAVYGLYHMDDPEVFYNREDLWTVASQVSGQGGQSLPMEPNFVLMTLPGERKTEFVEVLPLTPANRNNLIGWIAGRSDDEHYGTALAFHFPKTKLVDGPLQVEARIDQNPQLSAQLSLWNQQGSHVRRGALLVIPIGRGLLYAEAIYLQAERSPMPELRLVVLAIQDRLGYGPTFETALSALFGAGANTLPAPAPQPVAAAQTATAAAAPPAGAPASSTDALIAEAARELADYQRLTAEGKLGEAGARLDALKRTLEELQKRRPDRR